MNLISTENIQYVPKACSLDVYITESEEIHTHTHTHTEYNNIYNVICDDIYHVIPIIIYIKTSLVKTHSIESSGSTAGGKGWIPGPRTKILCSVQHYQNNNNNNICVLL